MSTFMTVTASLAAIYLGLGVIASGFLRQTPYADNPLWSLILLWPLYVFG